jgi:hypothetical protein
MTLINLVTGRGWDCEFIYSVQFIRRTLTWHGLLNYTLIIRLFYIILSMIIRL